MVVITAASSSMRTIGEMKRSQASSTVAEKPREVIGEPTGPTLEARGSHS